MLTNSQKKLLFISSLGGVLEFYDFIIYALLASYIATNFFPTGNNVTSLMATFTTFSVGYLVRPLGGILFGHFGDKLGRKKSFTVSVLMMAVATFFIGLVPSYKAIGISAPILLTVLRVFQGLSVGGEIPGAIAYVSESVPERKGIACSIIFCALNNGIVLGSLMDAILSTVLSSEQMLLWGWRIPFFIGGIFGIFSYLLRKQLEESILFKALKNKVEAIPLLTVLRYDFVNILSGSLIVALGASIITLLFLFIPAYLSKILHKPTQMFLWFNTAAIFLSSFLTIMVGYFADKIDNKKLLMLLILLTVIFIYPIFSIYADRFSLFCWALLMTALLNALAWGVIPGLLSELFPTHVRYSGIAVSYNLGFAIFGGLTPIIASYLIFKTQWNLAPIFYLLFTSLLCIFGLAFVRLKKVQFLTVM